MEKSSACTIWKRAELISNNREKEAYYPAEIKVYGRWVCALPESESNITGIFRDLSFREIAIYLICSKNCEPESLELSNVSDNIIFGLRKARHLGLPTEKATDLMVWQFIGILIPFRFGNRRDMFDDSIKRSARSEKSIFMIPRWE